MEQIALLSISADDLRCLVTCALEDALARRAVETSAPSSPATEDADTYLSRREVSRMLHLTYATLRNLELRGELTPVRIARRVLYRRRDVDAALRDRGGKRG